MYVKSAKGCFCFRCVGEAISLPQTEDKLGITQICAKYHDIHTFLDKGQITQNKAGTMPATSAFGDFSLYRRLLRRRGKNRQIYLRFSQSHSECRLCLHSAGGYKIRPYDIFLFFFRIRSLFISQSLNSNLTVCKLSNKEGKRFFIFFKRGNRHCDVCAEIGKFLRCPRL